MDYYLNQLTNQFTRSIGFPGSVTTATFKARDTITLDVYFHNGSNLLALAEGASLVFIIKASFEQNAVALALADEWDEIASGHYRSQLNLNTEALITAMGDLDLLNLFAELTWSETPGHWESSPTLRVRLNNDLYKGIEGTPLALPTPLSWLTANLTQSKIQTSITNDPTFRAAIGAAASDDVPPVLTVLLGESWSNGTVLRLDVSGFGAYFALGETYDASPVFRPLVNDGVGTLPRVRYEPSGSEGEGWYFDYDAGTAFFLASDNSAYPPTEQLWEDRIGSDTISVLTTIEFDANPSASKVGQHLHIALADGGVEMREALRINPTIWSEPMTRGVSQIIEVDDPYASFEPITSADDATIITPRRFWIYLSYWLTRTADKTISGAVSFLNSITVSGSATVGSLIAATSARVTGAPTTPATSDSLVTFAQANAQYLTHALAFSQAYREWLWATPATTGAVTGGSVESSSNILTLITTTASGAIARAVLSPWAGGLSKDHGRRVNWSIFRGMAFRVSCESMGVVNANAVAMISLGKSSADSAGDLVSRGIALRLLGTGTGTAALWGQVHNGTVLTNVNLNFTLGSSHALASVEITSNTTGSVTWTVNGVVRGTTNNGPTGSTSSEVLLIAETTGAANSTRVSVSPITTYVP